MKRLNLLEKYLKDNNHQSIDEKLEKFELYFDALTQWNEKFNLTTITDINEAQIKHFIDSLLGNEYINDCDYICDIGCGAGFPSIPLAIVNPDKNFTLVDSVNKKITFINHIKELLCLDNITAIHSRAEDFAKQNFEKFDCCIARALAQMPTLAEYALPLIKPQGKFVAYKGINYKEELENSKKILTLLNSQIYSISELNLTKDEKRYLIIVKKLRNCSKKYPRNANKPRTQPIIG